MFQGQGVIHGVYSVRRTGGGGGGGGGVTFSSSR
jgi:hypothetical protein